MKTLFRHPGGTELLCVDRGAATRWAVNGAEARLVEPLSPSPQTLVASGDGRWLATVAGEGLVRAPWGRWSQRAQVDGALGAAELKALSPDGEVLLCVDQDTETLQVRSAAAGYATVQTAQVGVAAAARGFAAAAGDDTVVASGSWVSGVTFSADGAWVASGAFSQGGGELCVWPLAGGRLGSERIILTEPHSPHCRVGLEDGAVSFGFSPDGRRLAACVSSPSLAEEGALAIVVVYDIAARRQEWLTVIQHRCQVELPFPEDHPEGFCGGVLWSPRGERLLVSSPAGAVIAFDGRTGASPGLWQTDTLLPLYGLTLDGAGQKVWAAGADGHPHVIDVQSPPAPVAFTDEDEEV